MIIILPPFFFFFWFLFCFVLFCFVFLSGVLVCLFVFCLFVREGAGLYCSLRPTKAAVHNIAISLPGLVRNFIVDNLGQHDVVLITPGLDHDCSLGLLMFLILNHWFLDSSFHGHDGQSYWVGLLGAMVRCWLCILMSCIGLITKLYLKEYSVILTTSFYDMNQKI